MKRIKNLVVTKYLFNPEVSYYHSNDVWFDNRHFYCNTMQLAFLSFSALLLSMEAPDNCFEARFIIQELRERSPYPVLLVPFKPEDNFSGREDEIFPELFRRFVHRLRELQREQHDQIRKKEFRTIKEHFQKFLKVTGYLNF